MAGNAVESGRTVTSKVTSILMVFADGSEWSLSELARITRIPLTTTHRLVTELTAAQLLERSSDGVPDRPGPRPSLRDRSTGGPTVAQLAPAVLDDLAAVTGRPARLGVLRDMRVAYVEKSGWAPPTSFGAGHSSRSTRARWARSCSRSLPPRSPARWSPRACPAYTAHPDPRGPAAARAVGDPADQDRDLRRRAGGRGDAVAAPVVGPGGQVVAALETIVPDLRGVDSVRQLLTVSARSMSRELAGPAAVRAGGAAAS